MQRCVNPSGGEGYVWIGPTMPVLVSTVRDIQTGCEYVLGTAYRKSTFMMPRMERMGSGDTAVTCMVQERSAQKG